MASVLDLDPRWRALMARGGVIDIGFDHPSEWPHAARDEQPFVKAGEDQLTAELCRVGTSRYIRAALTLPIRGSDDTVGIAIWVEAAPATFYAYLDTFEGSPAPATTVATLANDLPPIAELGAGLSLDFGEGTARPAATLAGTVDMSLDDLITLYEASGTLTRDDLRNTQQSDG
ncbi:DUF2199 domain-containing protein [Celeribacter sp.]|uniref:DUF2199 domain-containing protein n=1 Tax=Celeribacter sp. TaxID=1890673 RepID=UPI003A8FB854